VSLTVQQIAELVGGTLVGDGAAVIESARCLSEAGPGDVTFIDNEKSIRQHPDVRAAAVITKPNLYRNGTPVIECDDPLTAFAAVFRVFHQQPELPFRGVNTRACLHRSVQIGSVVDVHPFATIDEGTILGERCRIHSGVRIGRNCRLGDDVTLHPNVVIYDGCTLGNRVIVHANSVIGSDGFGYRTQGGEHVKVPQLGTVAIGDDVEIGACTTIDRGAFQATRIGAGTKIDNLVQIAHNCRVGRHNLIVSQVGIAGSSGTGDYVVIAGQAAVSDHCTLGDQVLVGARAAVIRDVPSGQRVLGEPAVPDREYKTLLLNLERLPELRKDVKRIKEKLGIE
jgi:UDP-3-O-[3-hydroxymyristoyl] glucosamine N-acyltransferase